MKIDINVWRRNLLDNGLKEIPLSGDVALKSTSLQKFHGDPADRMIVATALHNDATLYTADKKILQWHHDLRRVDVGQ